jgi:hypothetical protein
LALASLCIVTTGAVAVAHADDQAGTPAAGAQAQTGAARIFLLRPSDVPHDARYAEGITKVVTEVQRFYKQEIGKTFQFSAVEEVVGEHPNDWYATTVCAGTPAYYVTCNANAELIRRFGLGQPDSRYPIVVYTLAENEGAVGNGGSGWASLTKHDADGAAGLNANKDEPYGGFNRWVGGLCHELGHALGLDHTPGGDGTIMSGDFYAYPNVRISEDEKSKILSGPYGNLFA